MAIDRGGSNKRLTGNTFLGVRPGTITKKTIREKARRDKEAAAKRAPVVNKALQNKNTLITQAKKRYELRPVGSDARIVRSLQNVINSKPTQNLGPAIEKAGAYSYSFKGASQYAINKDFLKNYTQATMPQNMIELAKNDAIRDTTSDRDSFDYTNKRGSDPEAQREIIEWGQKIMFDEEAIEDWVLAGVTYQEKCRRAQYVEDWFSNPNNIRSSWTVNPGEGGLYTVPMLTDKAKLPEWVKPTSDNQNYWDYYKTYSTSVNKANVDAYKRMKDAEWEKKVKPYSSAFSSDGYENDANSFADILIKSNTTEQLRANTAQYFKDYLVNPVIHGHRLTAVGNMLWNFMETADIAARGVRAFVAGDVVLGGSGGTWSKDEYDFGEGTYADYMRGSAYGIKHTSGRNPDAKFKGQQVYWIKLRGHSDEEAKKAQLLFMDNGGYELLMRDFPVLATKAGLSSKYASMSREELEDELRLKFANSDISWQDVYRTIANEYVPSRAHNDLQQAVTNVKAAYSDINADFSAQTGSLLGDIMVESVLDPGLVAGGISKGAVKSGVRSAAENAISEGFRAIGRDSDNMAKLLNDKRFISAVNEFVNHNEGKNIIFKNNKEFLADITHFMDRTHKEFGLFDNLTDRNAFRRVVYGQLMDKQISVAGRIIEPQTFARKALDNKAFKAAYYLDRSIDVIDSAIAKSSFMVPWGIYKLGKYGIKVTAGIPAAIRIAERLALRRNTALRTMHGERTGKINVLKIADVMDMHNAGIIREKDVRLTLKLAIDQYDEVALNTKHILSDFRAGKITDSEAIEMFSKGISDITDAAFTSIDDLSAYVKSLDLRNAGDIQQAFDRIQRAYDDLTAAINSNVDDAARVVHEHNITGGLVDEGIKAVSKVSDRTYVRKISIDQFKDALTKSGFNLDIDVPSEYASDRTVVKLYDKMKTFLSNWEKDTYVHYNVKDLMSQIDRFERYAQFSYAMQWEVASETSALTAHRVTAQFNKLRRQIKHLDMISLKDTKYISFMHTDRMALHMEYRNSPEVQKIYGEFVENIIDPILDAIKGMTSEERQLVDSSLIKELEEIKDISNGFLITNNLIDDLKVMKYSTDAKAQTVINALANNFGYHGDLETLVANPDMLREHLTATLRSRTGAPKFGIDSMSDGLRSIGSDNVPEMFKAYSEEVKANPELGRRLNRYVKKSRVNPSSYVEQQMLFSALADPTLIKDWDNAAANGQALIFWHVNTTGLNNEIHSMTSISARQWIPLNLAEDEPLTLERLLDAFEQGETKVFQRRMRDSEFDEITENMLRRMDMKGATRAQMIEQYKKIYGVTDKHPYKSEQDMVRDACVFLRDNSYTITEENGIRVTAPTLVVHDLDGFNMNYFNNRVHAMSPNLSVDDPISNYADRLSRSVADSQINTYDTFARKAEDYYYTDEEIDVLVHKLTGYVEDLKHYASSYLANEDAYAQHYKFMDMSTYSYKLNNLVNELTNKDAVNRTNDLEKRFLKLFEDNEGAMLLDDYTNVVHNIEQLTLAPRGYAFASNSANRDLVHSALQAAGHDTVNIESRVAVDDVLSYFNINVADGFYVAAEDLRKMHDMASYIIRKRDREITEGAEEYLSKYRPQFERMIQSMINTAQNSKWEGTELAYIAQLKIPETSVEVFLMARKLYNDHLKYWLDNDIAVGLTNDGRELDELKYSIWAETSVLDKDDPMRAVLNDIKFQRVTEYINSYKRRFFDELTGGGFNSEDYTGLMNEFEMERHAYNERYKTAYGDTFAELKETNAQLKNEFIAAHNEEWEGYRAFSNKVDELYQKELDKLDTIYTEQFKPEQQEKWDYFFNTVKPERERLQDLMDEAAIMHNHHAVETYEQRLSSLNHVWQQYNSHYMHKWFINLSRERVYEPYKFKDPKLTARYNELRKQLEFVTKLDDSEKIEAAEAAIKELGESSAINRFTRRTWLEWHGDLIITARRNAIRKEKAMIKRGQLLYTEEPLTDIFTSNPELVDEYKAWVDNGHSLLETQRRTTELHGDYRLKLDDDFFEASEDAELHLIDATTEFMEARTRFADALAGDIDSFLEQHSDDFFNILDGESENPMIFKKYARSDYEKKLVRYENGVMRQGVDTSRKCSAAQAEVNSKLKDLKRIDEFTTKYGTYRSDQRLLGATHRKAEQLFDMLHSLGIAKRPTFQGFIEKVSEVRQLQLQQARMNALKDVHGSFSRDVMLQELVYNGFNMTVFNSHCYSPEEIRNLRDAVKHWQSRGDDIFGYFEDERTGNVFVYLKDSVTVSETSDLRWINGTLRIDKPTIKPHIAFAEFDELLPYLDDIPDAEVYRGIYNHLLSCWDDTRMLSLGAINGTSGRTVSLRQAEEFIQSLPDELSDWCTSEGLLRAELSRDVIYDPGFVRSDTPDMLFDFMDTLHRQATVAREDTLLASMVMNGNDNLSFRELAKDFTDEQLIQYFGESPDYVVCAILPKQGTATGFQVRQIKLSNAAALQSAKTLDGVTVMPYDAYYELANIMNRTQTDSVYRRLLSKYMYVYKAFALVRPGTWVRNYVDATTKASIESGGGLTEGAMMLQYEAKAVKGIGLATKLAKVDPSFLNEANWDVIQRTFGTDLTYEDFEILRGVVDAERFSPADRRLINRTAERRAGQNIISGENIGIRNLDEKDITTAFKKYLDGETNFKKDEFLDIYIHGTDDPELARQFEDAMLKLSNNLRRADMSTILDKSVRTMFKPFGTVEQVVRYAQTMYLKDMGLSQNQITKKLHASQFYNAPSWGPWSKLETIMPFITFKYNNIMFWIRMMDENPRYFRYFEDIYGNIAEDTLESMEQQGQDIDYENDYALQSGAVPIGCGKYYFNLGNSFLSAMNDFYDLPFQINSLNPLLRDSVKLSLYVLGFNSKEFFSNIDLDITDDDPGKKLRDLIPGGDLTYKTYKLFKDVGKYCSETNGPSMDALMAFCKYASLVGSRNIYARNGSFDFEQWQEELAEQGKWYDANTGRVVSLSEKNELGANNPESSFEDIQAYQLLHFGKIWDANQRKFVLPEDYIDGGYNNGFDWDNDPEGAWEALQAYMLRHGKVYDYNQRKFVYEHQYIEGGLNDPDITFAKKRQLMEEKFGLYWDGNRCAWVEKDRIIPGGLNDTKNFREVMSLRLAMFGETYDRVTHKFNKTTDPKIVVVQNLEDKRFNNYYSRLGIPSLTFVSQGINVNSEGLLVTNDGKYIITGNPEHDNRIFEKFKYTFGGRGYRGWKRYSHWRNFNWSKKPYKGRTLPQHYYTGYGWNDEEGYYRFNYSYNYQYHNPQPGRKLHRLLSPRIQYPYGGGYNKYSFYTR